MMTRPFERKGVDRPPSTGGTSRYFYFMLNSHQRVNPVGDFSKPGHNITYPVSNSRQLSFVTHIIVHGLMNTMAMVAQVQVMLLFKTASHYVFLTGLELM